MLTKLVNEKSLAEERNPADVVPLYRWVKNASRRSRHEPGLTIVCDQNFLVESFVVHSPDTPVLGPRPERWPGHKLYDHLPRFLMHLLANATQRSVGCPHPIETKYPIKIGDAWYRSDTQITADPALKRFILKVKRSPLVIGYREPARVALSWLCACGTAWAV